MTTNNQPLDDCARHAEELMTLILTVKGPMKNKGGCWDPGGPSPIGCPDAQWPRRTRSRGRRFVVPAGGIARRSSGAERPAGGVARACTTMAGAELVSRNSTVLAHIVHMRDETLRAGVRESLFPAMAATGWSIGDAIEAIWAGNTSPEAGAGVDANSADAVAALAELARAPPPDASAAPQLAFAFVRNPASLAAAPSVDGGAGVDYDRSRAFWRAQAPTLAAMLGGLERTHAPDVEGSLRFLEHLGHARAASSAADPGRALDCGTGVGRVAQHVLLRRFGLVDLVEQDERFLAQARAELPAERVGECMCAPLQSAPLDAGGRRYTCIWVQWVLNYLTDEDCVALLRRAASALAPADGVLVVKETHVRAGSDDLLDRGDASICRAEAHFERLFAEAGLAIRSSALDSGLPRELLPVRMWALNPAAPPAARTGDQTGDRAPI